VFVNKSIAYGAAAVAVSTQKPPQQHFERAKSKQASIYQTAYIGGEGHTAAHNRQGAGEAASPGSK
jgi:hypothetical protein